MFDFAWSEIAIIAVVALVLIGPKDMPVALKGVTDMLKKARRMAGEFQTHVDEMMREADLGEVREQFKEIRNFNIRGAVERAIDQDGSIRRTFTENPLAPDPVTVSAPPAAPGPKPDLVVAGIVPPPVTLKPGASPFEVSVPMVGALTFPERVKTEHPPFPSLFGDPVPGAPAFVPPAFVAPGEVGEQAKAEAQAGA